MTGGIGLLLAVLVYFALHLGAWYVQWRGEDRNRRLERLERRGLA